LTKDDIHSLVRDTILPLKEEVATLGVTLNRLLEMMLKNEEEDDEGNGHAPDMTNVTTTYGDNVEVNYVNTESSLLNITLIDIINQGFSVTIKK